MAWTLVASVTGQSAAGGGTFTTSAIDTTGADLIVVALSAAGSAMSDSKSNSYTGIGPVGAGGGSGIQLCLFAKWQPTVGSGHTFSMNAPPVTPAGAMVVLAYSGSFVASTAIDQGTGANNGAGGTTLQPGSITPTANGELVICGCGQESVTGGNALSIDLGFSELFELGYVPVDHYGLAVASLTQTTAAAINPTWTCTGSAQMVALIMSFKVEPAAAGGLPFLTVVDARRL